ncbi:hypothetical protein Tco_0409182 [Tanacetum coccineum]
MTLSHPAWFRFQRVQGYPVKDSGLGSSCVQHVKQIKPSRRMAMVASGPGTQNLRDGPGLRQFFSSELEFVPDEFSAFILSSGRRQVAHRSNEDQPDRNMLRQNGAIRGTRYSIYQELRMTGLAFDSPYLTPPSTGRYVPPEVVRAFFEIESVNLFTGK